MIPTSGTFLPGATSVAQFSPSSSPSSYSGGSVIIEDLLLGHAGSTRYFGAPLFSSISVLPSGAVQLLLSTELGSACEIQASPNLLAWSHVTTMTNFTGSLQYTDNPSPISNARFYRAVQLPQ
jgi:hypothetical protein